MADVLRTPMPTVAERYQAGQALRGKVRRRELGRWKPADDRPDH